MNGKVTVSVGDGELVPVQPQSHPEDYRGALDMAHTANLEQDMEERPWGALGWQCRDCSQ